ncbi:MAG TPA: glycosyltransferase [Chthonomonadaceae bacterium]|nr:glycosyltransferase [Chthonomonadaceae bacterium]
MKSPSRPSTSDPIRILIGHLDTELPEIAADRFDVRMVRYLPEGAGSPPTIASMLAQCPPDWKPDIYYHASLVHFPIPTDIEEFDGLTATNIQDWHRGGRAVWAGAGFFDWIATERNACALLKASGYENAFFARFWGADPKLHRILPDVAKDIDVLFIGSLNASVWEERNRWIDRLAGLSSRFRVLVAMGHYGEQYVRLTNRARIVFNRSVNGCTNQRAYDASPCGALVFNEEENGEVREIFQDRVHCVYYNEHNLESLLEHYLTHDEERARITENCRQLVLANHTEAAHTEALFTELASRLGTPRYRPSAQLPAAERNARKALQIYSQALVGGAETAYQLLDRAEAEGYRRPYLLEARAALHGWVGHHVKTEEKPRQFTLGIEWARQCILAAPTNALAHMTLGFLLLERSEATQGKPPAGRNDIIEAAVALATAAELCRQELPGNPASEADESAPNARPAEGDSVSAEVAAVEGLGYPRWADGFDCHIERNYLARGVKEAEWVKRMRAAIGWRCRTMLSDLAAANGQGEEAWRQAVAAVQALPAEAEAWLRLARCEAMTGRLGEAIENYRAGLSLTPLSAEAWVELTTVLVAAGLKEQAEEFVRERLQVIEAIPSLAAIRPALLAALQYKRDSP